MSLGIALGLPFSPQDSVNVLKRLGAVWAIDAAESKVGEQYSKTVNDQYPGMHAKYGSTVGAQIVNGAFRTPRVNGNYAAIPDSAATDILDDLELIICSSTESAVTAAGATAGMFTKNNAYRLIYSSVLNQHRFEIYDGAVWSGVVGAFTIVDGLKYWIKCTRVKSTGLMSIYYSTDGTNYTLSNTAVVLAGSSILNGGTQLEIFARDNGIACPGGTVHYASVSPTIGGTPSVIVDFSKAPDLATSFTCDTGQTVTVTSSTTGVDTNDPTFLPWTGEKYFYQPSSTAGSNYISTPSTTDIEFTGDFSGAVKLYVREVFVDKVLLIKRQNGVDANLISYNFSLWNVGTGRLKLMYTNAAGVTNTVFGIVNHNIVVGQTYWFGFSFDVDNGAGGNTVHFYKSADGVTWTLIESFVTAGVADIRTSTAQLGVGGTDTGAAGAEGGYIEAKLWSGLNMSVAPVLHWRALDMGQAGGTSNSRVWTINRFSTGKKAALVTRPTWLFGTNDYMEVADNALLDSDTSENLSVVLIERRFDDTANQILIAKGPAGPGWQIRDGGISPFLGKAIQVIEGANNITNFISPQPTSGENKVIVGIIDKTANLLRSYVNNSATSTALTGSPNSHANALSMFVGASSGTTGFWSGEITAAAIFRRVLTAQEISQIVSYYGAS